MTLHPSKPCALALDTGEFFYGKSFGATGTSTGELVFNTAMSGYQEILTDPSYKMQVILMTYPEIGNYGTHRDFNESEQIHAHGFVVKKYNRFSDPRLDRTPLHEFLIKNHIIALEGVDTRKITKIIRTSGSKKCAISTELLTAAALVKVAHESTSIDNVDLTSAVTLPEVKTYETPGSTYTVALLDYGTKLNIIRELQKRSCKVLVFPATTKAEEVLSHRPDGIMLSNGPGNPDNVPTEIITTIKNLVGKKPLFGICFGHQLLMKAMGYHTFKLNFGHHAANHPVKNLTTGKIEITSQNHNFAIKEQPEEQGLSHLNINDFTNAGFTLTYQKCFSVQYHPEASPGPHDSNYLFDDFINLMKNKN